LNYRPVYLDTSALAKLIIPEAESRALAAWLIDWPDRFTSALTRVEIMRLLRRGQATPGMFSRAEAVLDSVVTLHLDRPVLATAAHLRDPLLRALDGIHLASALSIGDLPDAFVTYDARLKRAAERLKLSVVCPR